MRRDGWLSGISLSALRDHLGAGPDDVIEVCIARGYHAVTVSDFTRFLYPRKLGLVGMEISYRGTIVRLAPTRMIASNRSFIRSLEVFIEKNDISFEELFTNGRVRTFATKQYLLLGDDQSKRVKLFRGSTLVSSRASNLENQADSLATGIEQWMRRNQSEDGKLPYKYWPSQGKHSSADNAIRRFLATISLARLGELRNDDDVRDSAYRNLRYNLKKYFRDIGDGCGVILEHDQAKLGAAALAGLAILHCSAQEEFGKQLKMLAASIGSMVDEETGFRTFFFPAERDGQNWNFYSGEALLFWAESSRCGLPFAPSTDECFIVFERCRNRHRAARNPAFVPWHTQACVSLFQQTGEREYAGVCV